VTGIVEEFVKLTGTVAASQRCSKQQKRATRQANGFINNDLKYHENQMISREPIQQQELFHRTGLERLSFTLLRIFNAHMVITSKTII
jgi:hypothetical protein